MIADCDTNVVFVADTLEKKLPHVHEQLSSILAERGVPVRAIPGTLDMWSRDYMPVQVRDDRFVQFVYKPDYLTGRYRHLRADGKIGPMLPWIKECVRSDIVLDGGNVVGWRDKVIMTIKVLARNRSRGRSKLLAELQNLLEVDRVILIPPEPEDVTCHADGVVRFVDNETVVINDYRQVDHEYRERLLRAFKGAGLKIVEIPCRPDSEVNEGMPSAVGNYVNFLRVGSLLVVPSYGRRDDEAVLMSLAAAFPRLVLTTLDCRELARLGGVLNCCTWTMKALSSRCR